MARGIITVLGLAAVLCATAAGAENPGTNVYPYSSAGPPGAAAYDLLNYKRHHARPDSEHPACPGGGRPPCESGDFNVTFSGDTALAVDAIPNAFGAIANIGAQEINCGKLTAVHAEVLAANAVPANDLAKNAPAPTDYERWTATLCGQDVAFLLGVWPADGKQEPYRVAYPFAP